MNREITKCSSNNVVQVWLINPEDRNRIHWSRGAGYRESVVIMNVYPLRSVNWGAQEKHWFLNNPIVLIIVLLPMKKKGFHPKTPKPKKVYSNKINVLPITRLISTDVRPNCVTSSNKWSWSSRSPLISITEQVNLADLTQWSWSNIVTELDYNRVTIMPTSYGNCINLYPSKR